MLTNKKDTSNIVCSNTRRLCCEYCRLRYPQVIQLRERRPCQLYITSNIIEKSQFSEFYNLELDFLDFLFSLIEDSQIAESVEQSSSFLNIFKTKVFGEESKVIFLRVRVVDIYCLCNVIETYSSVFWILQFTRFFGDFQELLFFFFFSQ